MKRFLRYIEKVWKRWDKCWVCGEVNCTSDECAEERLDIGTW